MVKLLKTVYGDQIYISRSDLEVDVTFDHLGFAKVNPIFKRSYFTGIAKSVLPELTQSVVSLTNLYDAFKNKANLVEILDNGHIRLSNDDQEWFVGEKVSDEEDEKMVGTCFERFAPFYNKLDAISEGSSGDWHIGRVNFTGSILERIVNYETVTVRDTLSQDIGIILTAKCFPNIKKVEAVCADFIYCDSSEKFMTVLSSGFFNGTVKFRMLVDTLRC